MSAENYWGLTAPPFASGKFFLSSSIHEVDARLNYLVERRDRLGVLVGDAGMGKTMVWQRLARMWRRRHEVAVTLNLVGLSDLEFAAQLALGLGAVSREYPPSSPTVVWREISDRLQVNAAQELRTILLFDDVHLATFQVQTAILRLLHGGLGGHYHPIILLSSDTVYFSRWAGPFLAQCPLRVDLEPWNLQDTQTFVRTALRHAGRERPIFEAHAIQLLHQLSSGCPRRIVRLADLSLMAGAADQATAIDAATVAAVYQELEVHPAQAA